MNKKVIIGLVIAGMAVGANADLTSFRWVNMTANNLLKADAVTPASVGTTVLTYLSTDNVIDYVGGWVYNTMGNDMFYQALGTGLSGRLTTGYMTETVLDYRGMYAYAIVVDMPLSDFIGTYGGNVANIPGGTLCDTTTMSVALANMDISPPPTAQTFTGGGGLVMDQVIPEPATFLLFGMGGMGAWMLRRSKIKAQEDAEADA